MLCFFVLFISFKVSAGERAGNGADSIVCSDRTILLDAYEMEQRLLTLSLPGETVSEKVTNAIKKIEKFDHEMWRSLSSRSNQIILDLEHRSQGPHAMFSLMFTNDTLPNIDDSLEFSLPPGCTIQQLIVQRVPRFPEDRSYVISAPIWDQLDLDQQALAVIHETWYNLLLDFGAKDSRFVRYMTGIIASEEYAEMSLFTYTQRIKLGEQFGINLPTYVKVDQRNYMTKFDWKTNDGEQLLFSFMAPMKFDIKHSGLKLKLSAENAEMTASHIAVSPKGKVLFLKGKAKLRMGEIYSLGNFRFSVDTYTNAVVHYNEKGILTKIWLKNVSSFLVENQKIPKDQYQDKLIFINLEVVNPAYDFVKASSEPTAEPEFKTLSDTEITPF